MSYIKEREDDCGIYVMWGKQYVADLERHEARKMLKELDAVVQKWNNEAFEEARAIVYKKQGLTC